MRNRHHGDEDAVADAGSAGRAMAGQWMIRGQRAGGVMGVLWRGPDGLARGRVRRLSRFTVCGGFGFSRAKRGRFGVRGCGAKGSPSARAARQGRLALPRGVCPRGGHLADAARWHGQWDALATVGRAVPGEPRSLDGRGDGDSGGPECRQTFLSAVAHDWTMAKPHQPERGGSHPILQGARPWARRRGVSRADKNVYSTLTAPAQPSHRSPACEKVAGCGGALAFRGQNAGGLVCGT